MTSAAIPQPPALAPAPQAGSAEAVAPRRALPYGLHTIEDDDVEAVVAALRSGLLAQGPRVAAFEDALAAKVEAPHAVACSSGTSALHLALLGLNVGPGDVCVVPAITFLSTATAARLCGAEVVFADVDPITGLLTAETLREALVRAGPQAKVALPVHLAGRLCDMAALAEVAAEFGVKLVEDGCHALGSRGPHGPAGASIHSAATTFSFHPVKNIACGEGGAVTTRDPELAARLKRLRNHGVTRDPAEMTDRELSFDAEGRPNPWAYEMQELGFNARMTDLEAALGLSQLAKLDRFAAKRRELSALYDQLLAPLSPWIEPIPTPPDQTLCPHLYVARIDFARLRRPRADLMRTLAAKGVGTQVHYIPVYRQPYFQKLCGEMRLAGAETYYTGALALPLYPTMEEVDVFGVALTLAQVLGAERTAWLAKPPGPR